MVLVGNTVMFSPADIEADRLGSLDVAGGVLRGVAGATVVAGFAVDFDVTAGTVVLAGDGDGQVGICLVGGDSTEEVLFLHMPVPLGS
jgi:hypothetical protein